MPALRLMQVCFTVVGIGAGGVSRVAAQQTTATISGIITATDSTEVDQADVEAVNRSTGFLIRVVAHHGRFLVQALEVGGPYTVTVRGIGFRAAAQDSLYLRIGEIRRLEFRLEPSPFELGPITVAGATSSERSFGGGVGTVVSDSMLRRLPSLNRILYDFVGLSPYVSLSGLGISGAGVNLHFNNFQIDGASASAINGRNPIGIAGGGKPIALEAVKEYEVVLAPYDVSEGDFAGVLVNGVTRSGTNELDGDLFGYFRNQDLARDVPLLRDAQYEKGQVGFTLGGPIVRDRFHFFATGEVQRFSTPAGGPYLGQSPVSATPVPVGEADIARFSHILEGYGLTAGSAGPINNGNPAVNLFGRLDLAIPRWNGRLVLQHSYTYGHVDFFGRGIDPFALSSTAFRQLSPTNVTTAQLWTGSRGGSTNELRFEHYDGPVRWDPSVREPLVTAMVPRADVEGFVDLEAGTETTPFSFDQGNDELTDNLRLSLGRHRLTLGAKLEWYHDTRFLVGLDYGFWSFSSLDSLSRGEADAYFIRKDFGGGRARVSGSEAALWVGDEWQVTDRFLLRAGVRNELPSVDGQPPYSAAFDSVFARRTDEMPEQRVLVSPRVGFEWDADRSRNTHLRGGAGIFVGRPPLTYWIEAFSRYGVGIRELHCSSAPDDPGLPPAFGPHYTEPPQTCANGAGFDATPGGPVAVLARDLTYPRVLRASFGLDQQLPWATVVTLEALYTKGVRDFFFLNRGLRQPVGTDSHGRVLYGSLDADGNVIPDLLSDRFRQVIELTSRSHSHSYEVAFRLTKSFSNRVEALASYTWSRVRDAQTPVGVLSHDAWASHPLAGRQDDLSPKISDYDQPHRVVVAATYTAPWIRWKTDLSIEYFGGSGSPFTYVAGDLNGDGNENDPIYIPRSALDAREIRFDGSPVEVAAQQLAFEQFVAGTPCLASQRGRIMARNSCRTPWINSLNVALRQGLPAPRGHSLTVEIQAFNFLNLLNSHWGAVEVANGGLLQQVGRTPGSLIQSQPVFRFDPNFVPFSGDNPDSYYQLQAGLRYSF